MTLQSDIERRAAELAQWNPTQTPEWALDFARREAADGTLPDYSPISIARREVQNAARDLATAQNAAHYDAEFVGRQFSRLLDAKRRFGALLDEAGLRHAAE